MDSKHYSSERHRYSGDQDDIPIREDSSSAPPTPGGRAWIGFYVSEQGRPKHYTPRDAQAAIAAQRQQIRKKLAAERKRSEQLRS